MVKRKTHEQFIQEVKNKFTNRYSILSVYQGTHEKLKIQHNECGYEYHASPAKILSGRGCPKCKFDKLHSMRRKTHQEFVENIRALVKNEYSVIGEYESSDSKIDMKHNICGNTYQVKPNNFMNGKRCPYCKERSLGERTLYRILKLHNLSFEEEKTFDGCADKNKLRYDFFVEDKVLIEYDGKQHFQLAGFGGISKERAIENLSNIQYRDELKNDFAKTNKIPLLRIPYTEINNIENILISFLEEQNILIKVASIC